MFGRDPIFQELRFKGYPGGAIRNRQQLLDLIIECRKGKKAMRIYKVGQGGYLSEGFLTSYSCITTSSNGNESFNYCAISTLGYKGHDRFWKTSTTLGDNNIVDKNGRHTGHNRHMVFTNRMSAEKYAKELQADVMYNKAVAAWHKYCDTAFNWGNN